MSEKIKIDIPVEELKGKAIKPGNPILLTYRGSITHGLYEEDSIDDIDLLSVYVAPTKHYLGFGRKKYNKGNDYFCGKYDVVNYEVSKFLNMAVKINPNVMGPIFCRDGHVVEMTESGEMIRANKELFFDTKRVYDAYSGYARGQYNKLKKDRGNLDDLQRLKRLHYKKKSGAEMAYEENEEYKHLSEKYYSGWMGEKRKEMVLEYGYDPKHACHTVRLLRNGREFLKNRTMNIDRTNIDREELMEIKKGEMEFGDVCDLIEVEFEKFDEVYDNLEEDVEADRDRVENLLTTILMRDLSLKIFLNFFFLIHSIDRYYSFIE